MKKIGTTAKRIILISNLSIFLDELVLMMLLIRALLEFTLRYFLSLVNQLVDPIGNLVHRVLIELVLQIIKVFFEVFDMVRTNFGEKVQDRLSCL